MFSSRRNLRAERTPELSWIQITPKAPYSRSAFELLPESESGAAARRAAAGGAPRDLFQRRPDFTVRATLGHRSACAGQLDLVQKPVEPFAGQPGRLVEPFACVNIVVLDRQHHEFLRFASPLVEFFVAFDRTDIVVARTD